MLLFLECNIFKPQNQYLYGCYLGFFNCLELWSMKKLGQDFLPLPSGFLWVFSIWFCFVVLLSIISASKLDRREMQHNV